MGAFAVKLFLFHVNSSQQAPLFSQRRNPTLSQSIRKSGAHDEVGDPLFLKSLRFLLFVTRRGKKCPKSGTPENETLSERNSLRPRKSVVEEAVTVTRLIVSLRSMILMKKCHI